MKNVMIAVCLILITAAVLFFGDFGGASVNQEYMRIHIRANSNLAVDQTVKYQVRDAIVSTMIPLVAEATTKQDADQIIQKNLNYLEQVANAVLRQNGFSYSAKASVRTEEFPTRVYDTLTLESGFYDALILELGEGTGDNWWCVVYPPLCFLEANPSSERIMYKSKILEILKGTIGK